MKTLESLWLDRTSRFTLQDQLTRQVKELIQRWKAGDHDGARELDAQLRPAIELLRIQTNPIPIKAALNELGHQVGGYRLPMVEPTEAELARVRACLERLNILQKA